MYKIQSLELLLPLLREDNLKALQTKFSFKNQNYTNS